MVLKELIFNSLLFWEGVVFSERTKIFNSFYLKELNFNFFYFGVVVLKDFWTDGLRFLTFVVVINSLVWKGFGGLERTDF